MAALFSPQHEQRISEVVAMQIRELESRFDQSMRTQNTNIESNIAAITASVMKLDEGVSGAYVKMGENMNDIVNRLGITQATLQADIDSNADLFRRTDVIVKKLQADKNNVDAMVCQVKQLTDTTVSNIGELATRVTHDLKSADENYVNFKRVVETAVAAGQNSLSIATATAGAAAGSASEGGSYKAKTLDADERMKILGSISGEEMISTVTEWYDKVLIKLESTIPGAREISEWCQSHETEISFEQIDQERLSDRITAHRINRELVSWMTSAFTGKGWNLAKAVSPQQGLEAWRIVYRHVTMQGQSRVQDEFGYLLKPAQVKKSLDIPVWIAQWEDRASKLASVSPVHSFPDELRRLVFY